MLLSFDQFDRNIRIYCVVRKGTPAMDAIRFAKWSPDLSSAVKKWIENNDYYTGYCDSDVWVFTSKNGETIRI